VNLLDGLDSHTNIFFNNIQSKNAINDIRLDPDAILAGLLKVVSKAKEVSPSYTLDVVVVDDVPPATKYDDSVYYTTIPDENAPVPELKDLSEFYELVGYFERDVVLERMKKREFVAKMSDCHFDLVDPRLLQYQDFDPSLLNRPKEYIGETQGGELRRKGLVQFLSAVRPDVLFTVLADGGGMIKTAPSIVDSVKEVVVVNFQDCYVSDRVIERYKGFLRKGRPDVIVTVIKIPCSIYTVKKDKMIIYHWLFNGRIGSTQRCCLVSNFFPDMGHLHEFFSSYYMHFLVEGDVKCRSDEFVPYREPDINHDSAVLTQYFLSEVNSNEGINSTFKRYDSSRGEIIQYVHHSIYREMVLKDMSALKDLVVVRLVDYVGGSAFGSSYMCATKIDHDDDNFKKVVSCQSGKAVLHDSDISPYIGSSSVLFSSARLSYLLFGEQVLSSMLERSSRKRVVLPKRTQYLCHLTDRGDVLFLDYYDLSLTFMERRAKLAALSLQLVPVYIDCMESVMIPHFSNSTFVNDKFSCVRDVYYSIMEYETDTVKNNCSIMMNVASFCRFHGFVKDGGGMICVFDSPVGVTSSSLRSFKSAYNVDSAREFCVFSKNPRIVYTQVKCVNDCIATHVDDDYFHACGSDIAWLNNV